MKVEFDRSEKTRPGGVERVATRRWDLLLHKVDGFSGLGFNQVGFGSIELELIHARWLSPRVVLLGVQVVR